MPNKGTKAPKSLPKLVRRTLGDLAVIRQSLVTAAAEPDDPSRPANSLLDLELAAELKSVVDELRRLLWAYVQALSAQSGKRPDEVLEWYKMELAVDMLRKARSRPSEPLPNQIAGHCTFEDLVTQALAVTAAHVEVQ